MHREQDPHVVLSTSPKLASLWKSLIVYAAAGWATVEILLAVRERMNLPELIDRVLFAIFLAGFVLTALLAGFAGDSRRGYLGRALRTLLIALVSAATALGIGYWLRGTKLPQAEVSVAVLPCSYSGDPEHSYLGQSLAQEIHVQLAGQPQLSVPSWRAVRMTHAVNATAAFAAAHLQVDNVALCELSDGAERLRFDVRLEREPGGAILLKRHFDIASAEIATTLSTVALVIAERLSPGTSDGARSAPNASIDPIAYDLYLQARSKDDYYAAVALYQQAIERDSAFADAYAGLARRQADFAMEAPSDSEQGWVVHRRAARTNALKALDLDDCNAEAWLLGVSLRSGDWDADFREQDAGAFAGRSNYELIQRAIECRPSFARAWRALGRQYHPQDYDGPELTDEEIRARSEEAMSRAAQLDPVDCELVLEANRFPGLGDILWRSAEEREAYRQDPQKVERQEQKRWSELESERLQKIRSMLVVDPSCGAAYAALTSLRTYQGRLDEALAWRIKAWELDPGNPSTMVDVADGYMILDMPTQAEAWSRRSQAIRYFTTNLPWSRLRQGDPGAAYEFVERFVSDVEANAHTDPVRHVFILSAQLMLEARDFTRAEELLSQGMTRLGSTDPVELLPPNERTLYRKLVAQDFARIYQELGQVELAERLLEQGRRAAPEDWDLSLGNLGVSFVYANARYEALRRDVAQAMAYIRRAVDEGQGYVGKPFPGMYELVMDPCIDTVRNDPVYGPRLRQLIEEYAARLAPMRERVLAAEQSGNWEPLRTF